MSRKLPCQYRHIPRRGIMLRRRHPRAIGKMRVLHSQLLRLFVHKRCKAAFASRRMLRQSHAGIVSACDYHAFYKLSCLIAFSFLQKHLGAIHCRSRRAYLHFILQAHLPCVNFIKQNAQRHHFCHARNRQTPVRFHFIQYFARGILHKHGSLCIRNCRCGVRRLRRGKRRRGA